MENRIIEEMLANGNISEKEAKKIFRKYSKLIHPDITKSNTEEEFIKLKNEYEEAILFIKNPENIKKRFEAFEENFYDLQSLRKKLYQLLNIYLTLGIYSQKIRLKQNLKNRNEKIINTILEIAYRYDNEFGILFKNYNSFYFLPFDQWYEERQLKNAGRLFINGVRSFLEYQKNGNILTMRMAESYFKDARYEYGLKASSEYQKNTLKLIDWFLKELSKNPLIEEFY
ncbi:MAG: hypothetical protein N2258_02870 [Brevinematales bacterium]|nr:hypothetical protein [Brevinematales bacterium]